MLNTPEPNLVSKTKLMEFLKLVVLQLSELNVKVILSVTLIPQVIERCQALNNSVRCHKEQSSLLLHKYLTARRV